MPQQSPFAGLNESVEGIGKLFLEAPKYQALAAEQQLNQVKTQKEQQQLAAASGVGELFQRAIANPEAFKQNIGAMAQNYVQGGGDLSKIGQMLRGVGAQAPGMSDDAKLNLSLGAGDAVSQNSAFSVEGQNRVAGRNNALDIAKERAAPKVLGAGASLYDPSIGDIIARGSPTPETVAGSAAVGLPDAQKRALAMKGITPRNYITADGRKGVTQDGTTDAATGENIPAGASIYTGQATQEGGGLLSKSGQNEIVKNQADLVQMQQEAGKLMELAKDPNLWGVVGTARGLGQDASVQMQNVADYFGGDTANKANQLVQSNLGDLAKKDPKLVEKQVRERNFVTLVAKAATGQSGRDLSGPDIKNVEDMATGLGLFSSGQAFATKLNTLLDIVATRYGINAELLKGQIPQLAGGTPERAAPQSPAGIQLDVAPNDLPAQNAPAVVKWGRDAQGNPVRLQ